MMILWNQNLTAPTNPLIGSLTHPMIKRGENWSAQ